MDGIEDILIGLPIPFDELFSLASGPGLDELDVNSLAGWHTARVLTGKLLINGKIDIAEFSDRQLECRVRRPSSWLRP